MVTTSHLFDTLLQGDTLTDLPVAQVSLVAQYNEREVGWVLRLALDQKLLPPLHQGRETSSGRDIKHQHAAVSSSVQRCTQRLEPLCARCVPDLREDLYSLILLACMLLVHLHGCVVVIHFSRTGGQRSYLQGDCVFVYGDCSGEEVSPYRGPVHVGEAVIHISVHEGGFSHPA